MTEKDYIKFKLLGYIDSKKLLSDKYDGEKIIGTIGEFIQKKYDISVERYKEYQKNNDAKIMRIKKLFNTEDRKKGFGDDIEEFYDWYIRQEEKCCYCGVLQDDLSIYFDKENNIQYKDARQRGKLLELERIVTASKDHNIYNKKNCRLACYICNNAKSDFLSAKDFKPIAKGISEFWKSRVKDIDFIEDDDIWNFDTKE